MRVLHIKHGFGMDGASKMVDGLACALSPLDVVSDVLVDQPLSDACSTFVDDVHRQGGTVYSIEDAWGASGKRMPHKLFKLLYTFKVMRRGGYAAVHLQTDTPSRAQMLMVAKAAGIKVRVAHSHSTSCAASETELDRQLSYRRKMAKYATHYLACSTDAGRWLFSDELVDSGQVKVLNNGIGVALYRFDEGRRRRMREDLRVDGKLVLSCIGRLTALKNVPFAIDICAELAARGAEPVLLVVGDGEERNALEDYAALAAPEGAVHFLGVRDDIPDLLQAIDVVLMPSRFEGLPVTLVEAQAASVPCVVSDAVSREADLAGEMTFLPLGDGMSAWADAVLARAQEPRSDRSEAVVRSGFSIDEVARELARIYRGDC